MRTRRRDQRGGLGRVIGTLVLIAIVAVVVVVIVAVTRGNDDDGLKGDVAIQACTADPGGGSPTATVSVRNNSSKKSDFAVTIAFKDPEGNQLSEGAASVTNVEAQADKAFEVKGNRDARGQVQCEVESVNRIETAGS